ncbi:MAG: inositol monophosphatase [Alicyclobacillus sp.]|nr:inositol monophosphatase [Alicyclobacillus sp.]
MEATPPEWPADVIARIVAVLTDISEFAVNHLPPVDGASVRTKRDAADLVSNRDLAMESQIVASIRREFPDHLILSEEMGQSGRKDSPFQWYVDPIDGSCNDSHGVPWSAVSVACAMEEEAVAGLVVQPHTKEVFQALRGRGATLNGRPIRVADPCSLAGSVVMTELVNQNAWEGMYAFMDEIARKDGTIRIMGSTALAILQVAAGRSVAAVFGRAGKLDVAASVLIAREAGALVLEEGRAARPLPHGRLTVCCPGVSEAVEAALRHGSRHRVGGGWT